MCVDVLCVLSGVCGVCTVCSVWRACVVSVGERVELMCLCLGVCVFVVFRVCVLGVLCDVAQYEQESHADQQVKTRA